MDINATLKELREITAEIHDEMDMAKLSDHASRMAELFDALDSWIMKGGFLPAEWQGKRS